MKTTLCSQLLCILALAYPLVAFETVQDVEIDSITGTREPETETVTEAWLKQDVQTTEVSPVLATTVSSSRQSRWYRPGSHGRGDDISYDHDHDHIIYHDHDDEPEMKQEMAQAKGAYWSGYYDFLINEGSYKFWAVFQLGTAALLIYSGFAALYYAKVNPTTEDDYEDYLLRRRRSVDRPPQDRTFLGLSPETFQRIIDAIAREFH